MSLHDTDSMQLHETLEEWDLLNRFAAWTGYFSTLLFVASTAAALVAFASGQVGWGLVALAAMATEAVVGSSVVGGITFYDRRTHHETPHLL